MIHRTVTILFDTLVGALAVTGQKLLDTADRLAHHRWALAIVLTDDLAGDDGRGYLGGCPGPR